ncbi:TPA: hypothetical protein ACGPI4_005401 [Bacillus paranthracis]
MKTYTGVDAIKRMETNWISVKGDTRQREYAYKMENEKIAVKVEGEVVKSIFISVEFFFAYEFIDYVESLKLEQGEMFVGESKLTSEKWYLIYERETERYYTVSFGVNIKKNHVSDVEEVASREGGTYRKATDEELQEFERFMVFYKKGRNMDEFKVGDQGEYDGKSYVVTETKTDGLQITMINSDETILVLPNAFEPHFFIEDIVG